MSPTTKKKMAAGALVLSSAGLLGLGGTNAATGAIGTAAAPPAGVAEAKLRPLNNSPVHGNAVVTVDGRRLDVQVNARRLLKNMPHAQHIHFGQQARNECPTVRDDENADHRINTVDGLPAYGPVRVSLTTRGDTSPRSTLAVNRFPAAKDRKINYDRDNIRTQRRVARAVANGRGVVVIHGIDYNSNGKYDFRAGRSDLDPKLPAEATDPVACGVLKEQPSGGLPVN